MTRIIRSVRPGTAPGSLSAPRQRVEKVRVSVLCYGADDVRELEVERIEDAFATIYRAQVTWINVVGLHDVELLQKLGHHFELHPLALEDVVNPGQRPKFEDYGSHVFVIMRLPHFSGSTLNVEQVSVFFGQGIVITLREIEEDDPFEPVRERILEGSPRIRSAGADYLAYAQLDSLVDSLYPVLEKYGEWIEGVEQALLEASDPTMLETIQGIRRDLLWIRRIAWPHREVMHGLERLETDLIKDDTREFLRDSYDHAVQLMDVVETFRELASGLTDLYLSTASNRMNEVMKVLTIMASIFIPLTFIAGIYGMNFNPASGPFSMPELDWGWGYPGALLTMLVIAGAMALYFKRKKWF